MFESRIPAGATAKLPCSDNLRIASRSYDMEGHAKKCVERYCELANKTTQQLCKVSTPCIDDHHFKEEELKSLGELSKVCTQIVLICLYLARIGQPDVLCVKSTSPVTENHYRNGYVNYKNFIMTNEDNNRDTMYTINKNHTNNHDTRDMHE